jgi:predicted TIM-barrel fold metal-dependent hydrolase
MEYRTQAGMNTANIEPEEQQPPMRGTEPAGSPGLLDPFVRMVSAKADVALKLTDYAPISMLQAGGGAPITPLFPAIDYHNHLDSLEPRNVLGVMDACGVEHLVNITMRVGDEALAVMRRFHQASPGRFSTIGWMDWSDLDMPGFFQRCVDRLERLVEHGAVGIKFWKDLGLLLRNPDGSLLRIDDERLAPVFAKAGELGVAVMFHTADPDAFFLPVDGSNERYEELAAHPEWGVQYAEVPKSELLAQRDRVFARHPETTFVAAHVGECGERLVRAAEMLDAHPNVLIDIGARTAELGRQPYTARAFFLRYADRILFGTDLLPEVEMYRAHYRFLETADEYFEYPSHASRQGRWNIYGLHLPPAILKQVYRDNALRILGSRIPGNSILR